MNRKTLLIAISTLAIGLLLGWALFSGTTQEAQSNHQHRPETGAETTWTCSMHPQVKQSEPGQCPICGMELIPQAQASGNRVDYTAVAMSSTARKLAQVRTEVVGTAQPLKKIKLNGKVRPDARRIYAQTTHLSGRIEKLMVNFTGERIEKDQVLAYVYSPELITAQEELFEARKVRESQPALFRSALDKLRNWKLSEAQIERIAKAEAPIEDFPIVADVSGYVLEKKVQKGDYLQKGQKLYEVADLSKVWLMFDLYESELAWVEEGDPVDLSVGALPGERFQGKIVYLDPVLDPQTRVAQARVEVPNPAGRLLPGMFARGVVRAKLEREGETVVVPQSAVLWTGQRSVVYVKNQSAREVSFALREVILGTELNPGYVVKKGLRPGEEIAVNGTFSIDAAAQLADKPSMMNPTGGGARPIDDQGTSTGTDSQSQRLKNSSLSTKYQEVIGPLIEAYLDMKKRLVEGDASQARAAAKQLTRAILPIEEEPSLASALKVWNKHGPLLKAAASKASTTGDIEKMRNRFVEVSNQVRPIVEAFGPTKQALYLQFCPMANRSQGAYWLSREKEIKNPYYGEAMLNCGEVKATIE